MRTQVAYRIFDDKDGLPHTLFHGVNGSRRLPFDTWVEARVGPVTDGSCATAYQSGFHVLEDRGEARKFLARMFKNLGHRVVARVEVRDTWPKAHSRHEVTLARFLRISRKDWARRTKLSARSPA